MIKKTTEDNSFFAEKILTHKHEKLSIIIPVYNEEKTIRKSYNRVKQVNFPVDIEVIIIDDGSSDNSYEIIKSIKTEDEDIIIFRNPRNMGKGASVVKGFSLATGTILIIHDADMEYDPNDIKKMLSIMLNRNYDVLYGKRPFYFRSRGAHKRNVIGNIGLNIIASLVYMRRILDFETCYKMIRRETIQGFSINSKHFDFEAEITAKLIRSGYDIHFTKISYNPRNYREGKKINWKDGILAFERLLRYRFTNFRDNEEFLEPMFRRSRIKRTVNYLSSEKTLLDIGCGADFKFLRSIKSLIKIGVGVDKNATKTHYGNLFITGQEIDKRLLFNDSRFDLVTMLAVLEHIEHPKNIINECCRVLRVGGKLLVTVPSKRSKGILEFLSYRLKIVSETEIRDHKNYFTKKGLIDMFEMAGFNDISTKSYNFGMNYFIVGTKQ